MGLNSLQATDIMKLYKMPISFYVIDYLEREN